MLTTLATCNHRPLGSWGRFNNGGPNGFLKGSGAYSFKSRSKMLQHLRLPAARLESSRVNFGARSNNVQSCPRFLYKITTIKSAHCTTVLVDPGPSKAPGSLPHSGTGPTVPGPRLGRAKWPKCCSICMCVYVCVFSRVHYFPQLRKSGDQQKCLSGVCARRGLRGSSRPEKTKYTYRLSALSLTSAAKSLSRDSEQIVPVICTPPNPRATL
jgi:hypothetical protein